MIYPHKTSPLHPHLGTPMPSKSKPRPGAAAPSPPATPAAPAAPSRSRSRGRGRAGPRGGHTLGHVHPKQMVGLDHEKNGSFRWFFRWFPRGFVSIQWFDMAFIT